MQHGHGVPRTLLHQASTRSGTFVTRPPEGPELGLPSFAPVMDPGMFQRAEGLEENQHHYEGLTPGAAPSEGTLSSAIHSEFPRLPPFSSLLAPPPGSLSAAATSSIPVPTGGRLRQVRKQLRPDVPSQWQVSAPLDIAAAASRWIESGGRSQRAVCFGCNRTFKKRDGRETHWARYLECERRHAEAVQGTLAVVDYNEMLEIRRKGRLRKERKTRCDISQ